MLEKREALRSQNKIRQYYPETGQLSRSAYPKHIAFMAAGRDNRERAVLGANRSGKTEGIGAYETTCHLTGEYPAWWQGKRFDRPVRAWASGETSLTTRDTIQRKLLGSFDDIGTGMIPKAKIYNTVRRSGIQEAIEKIYVRHAAGGMSTLNLKSYEQGRKAFESDDIHFIWLDEEPEQAIYTASVMRTMTTDGCVILTMTPLLGLSDVVKTFLPDGRIESAQKYTKMITWDDAPHLTAQAKKELWDSIPPYQREARSKGVPQLGAGAIFPIAEEDIIIPNFPIPEHYVQCYGMDVGWAKTAALKMAVDRETGIHYFIGEYYRGQEEPGVHYIGINSLAGWAPGVIDPAANASNQRDGTKLLQEYVELGLDLTKARNSVEAALYKIYSLMTMGKFKVFQSLQHWLTEFRTYHRDENGKIVNDAAYHLMACTRYLILSGMGVAKTKPVDKGEYKPIIGYESVGGGNKKSWMG